MSDQVQSYYPKRSRLLLLFVACVVFTAGMVWILIDPAGVPPRAYLASWIGAPGLGLVSLYLLVRLVWRKPSVLLDSKGLRDNASMFSAGFIPWDDIESVTVYSTVGGRMVGVVLKDNDKFLARLGPLRRKLSSAGLSQGPPLVAIPETTVSVPVDDLAKEIEKRLASRGMRDETKGMRAEG